MNQTNSSSGPKPDTGMPTFAIIMITLQLTIMVVVVIGNGLVLLAVCYFRSLRDITGIFVANLALSDLILGLSLPYQVIFFFYPELETNKYACLMRFEVIMFTSNASLFSLVCTVIDRYVAITRPMYYVTIMTEKRAYVMIVFTWIVALVPALIPAFGVNNFDTSPFCLYEFVMDKYFIVFNSGQACLLCIMMFLAYVRIFSIVRRHVNQIHSDTGPHNGHGTVKKSKQMNTIIALVVLFFQISWLPFFIIQFTSVYEVTPTKVMVANFLVFLGIMNSMVNPIVYAWKNKRYRRAFAKILCFRLETSELDTSFGST